MWLKELFDCVRLERPTNIAKGKQKLLSSGNQMNIMMNGTESFSEGTLVTGWRKWAKRPNMLTLRHLFSALTANTLWPHTVGCKQNDGECSGFACGHATKGPSEVLRGNLTGHAHAMHQCSSLWDSLAVLVAADPSLYARMNEGAAVFSRGEKTSSEKSCHKGGQFVKLVGFCST